MTAAESITAWATRTPEHVFLIDAQAGRRLTYAEADQTVGAAAADLLARGLAPGDRVAISLPNSLETAVLYLAALYAGLVTVPIGVGFGRRELRSILDRTRPKLLVTESGDLGSIGVLAEELGVPAVEASVNGARAEFDPLTGREPRHRAHVADDDLVSIHFTSGTTGVPRGVGHRLRDFVANAERYAQAAGVGAHSRFHATLPMTYMAGYYNLLLLPMTVGASVVLDRAFDARSLLSFWRAPIEHGANVLWLVPTMIAMLLEMDRSEDGAAWCRDNVDLVACGTAPLEPESARRFTERYGVEIHDSYGLSETLLATASTPARPAATGAVGAALPGVDVEIWGADGAPTPAGEPGTIVIASPDTMIGYLGEDGSFESPLRGGRWLETGDIGVLDGDGQLRITGRSKEVIIRGGVNVGPGDVERVFDAHEAVERVAVVGVPHDILGEEIAAVVVCTDGRPLEELEPALRQLARDQLQPPQQPGVYVQIDALPTTPTGKVRRGALRDQVIDRLGLSPAGKGFVVDDPAPAPTPVAPSGRLVDLSHPLRTGMTTFPSPNHPPVEITQLANHADQGRATRRLVLGTHSGTHVDAPLHFIEGGAAVDALQLDALVGPAVVADLTPSDALEEVGVEQLRGALGRAPRHPRVLLRFDWDKRFDDPEEYYSCSPFLSLEACQWLVDQGVVLLGLDSASPDDPRNGFGSGNDSPNHKVLLGAGVILLEYLAGLDQIGSEDAYLVALPLRVAGGDGAPTRAVAFIP
jgi:acyl-coenzyme A synthetase/AMP-(fatty) acid ligase/kynurenine formamidase